MPAAHGGGCGCEEGKFFAEALQTGAECSPSTWSHPGATVCTMCRAGYFLLSERRHCTLRTLTLTLSLTLTLILSLG